MSLLENDYSFQYKGDEFTVTQQMKDVFDKHGFIIVRVLSRKANYIEWTFVCPPDHPSTRRILHAPDSHEHFRYFYRSVLDEEELSKLKKAVEDDDGVIKHSYGRDDGHGRRTRISLWDHPGSDVTGALAKCNKVVETMEQLLDGEVYHYHSKLIMKDARTGGAHLWHQDYGYWYKYGCMYPDMGSVMIALDKCTPANGSLQVLPGSHLAGRIDHVKIGGQLGADPERVKRIEEHIQRVHANLNPGDALFFHCNLLHTSAQNHSDMRRWVFIISYNRASNNPIYDSHHPQYVPLDRAGNDAIKKCQNMTDLTGKTFYNPKNDNLSMKLPGLDRH